MSQRFLLAIAAALGLLVLGLALFWEPGPLPSAARGRAGPSGGDFVLQSADGPVSLKGYRGKLVLLSFGYTYCPDICPTSLTAMAAGLRLLAPAEAARVAVLFVSVDPERDTPAHLKDYVAFFHPAMVGATGSPSQVEAVAKWYGVYFARQKAGTAGGYVMDHSAETLVIGTDGTLAARIPHAAPPEQWADAIRKHLDRR